MSTPLVTRIAKPAYDTLGVSAKGSVDDEAVNEGDADVPTVAVVVDVGGVPTVAVLVRDAVTGVAVCVPVGATRGPLAVADCDAVSLAACDGETVLVAVPTCEVVAVAA